MRLLFLLALFQGLAAGPALAQSPQRVRLPYDPVEGFPLEVVIDTDSLTQNGRAVIPDSLVLKVAIFRANDTNRLLLGTATRIAPRRYRYYLPANLNTLKPGLHDLDVLIAYGSGTYPMYQFNVLQNRTK